MQENYSVLIGKKKDINLPSDISDFLDRLYIALENATLEELIEISHEDSEWGAKHSFYSKKDQKMDSLSKADEYKTQYKDMLTVLDRMEL